jgi:multidrug transporter EmrE-like cation transporter
MKVNLDAWVLVFIAGINTCIGNLFLKKSRLVATDPSLFSLLFSPWFIGGAFLASTSLSLLNL